MSSTGATAYAAERTIGRLLIAVTYVSVGLLAVGFALMIANGISPLDAGPPLDIATLGAQLVALDPAGFLWLGLLTVIAAPVGRVIVAAVSYGRDDDWTMVAISIAILAVIVVGVVTAIAVTV
jgi:uncharacterized membrane protein